MSSAPKPGSAGSLKTNSLASDMYNGLDALSHQQISQARAYFASAVASSPTNADANFYLGCTRLLELPLLPESQTLMDRLGVSSSGRDIFNWTATFQRSGGNIYLPATAPTGLEVQSYLTATVKTRLIASLANFAVLPSNYTTFMPASITGWPTSIDVDYGDIAFFKSALHAMVAGIMVVEKYNVTINLATPWNGYWSKQNNIITDTLSAYPNFLRLRTSETEPLAGVEPELRAFADEWFNAINFIQLETDPAHQGLITITEQNSESLADLGGMISGIRAALNGETHITAFSRWHQMTFLATNLRRLPVISPMLEKLPRIYSWFDRWYDYQSHYLNLRPLLHGRMHLRSYLPTLFNGDNTANTNSFPDNTMGGVYRVYSILIQSFVVDPIGSPQTANRPFSVRVAGLGRQHYTVHAFNQPVTLSAEIPVGVGSGESNTILPASHPSVRTHVIYPASAIGAAGPISSLALETSRLPNCTLKNWTIRMQHTALSSFASRTFVNSSWQTVYQGNFTAPTQGWATFDFQTPFNYNGTQNLMISFSFDNGSATGDLVDGLCLGTWYGTNRAIYHLGNSGEGNPLLWSSSPPDILYSGFVPNLMLGNRTRVQATPLTSPAFSNGSARFMVTLPVSRNGVRLRVVEEGLHSGVSNVFSVVPASSSAQRHWQTYR